jgi:hypothetical protein
MGKREEYDGENDIEKSWTRRKEKRRVVCDEVVLGVVARGRRTETRPV